MERHGPPLPASRGRLALAGAVVVIIVALAAGCSPSPSAGLPTPSAAGSAPTGTLEPTIDPGLSALIGRIREGLGRQGSFVTGVGAAADNPALGVVATQMRAWALNETRWLADNPSLDCYRDAFDAYAAGVNDIQAAADGFALLARASAPPTNEAAQLPVSQLTQARTEMTSAQTRANVDRDACG